MDRCLTVLANWNTYCDWTVPIFCYNSGNSCRLSHEGLQMVILVTVVTDNILLI